MLNILKQCFKELYVNKFIALSALAISAIAGAAHAQGEPSWDIDGYAALTSDFRDRGLRYSDGGSSVYASLSAFHQSGLYGGIEVALIDDGFTSGERTEVFAGYGFDAGNYIYDFSVEVEGVHLGTSSYYPEIKASIARDFGLAYIRGGLAFAPEGRWNAPDIDSYYSYIDLEVPVPLLSQLTVLTHVGYDVRGGSNNLWDWSVGVSAFVFENIELGIAYENSSLDAPIGKGGVIFNAKVYF